MSYVKTTWATGDVVTAVKMNNMESGIETANKLGENIAAEYDATADYAVGDFCTYEGVLYKCNTAITGGETWTAAHWTAAKVTDEMGSGTQSSMKYIVHVDYDEGSDWTVTETFADVYAAYNAGKIILLNDAYSSEETNYYPRNEYDAVSTSGYIAIAYNYYNERYEDTVTMKLKLYPGTEQIVFEDDV